MRSIAAFVLGAVLVLAVPAARAQSYINIRKETLSAARINDLAINSARWTGWVSVPERRSIVIEVSYTWSAASAVTMRCETSDDNTTANDSGFDLPILSDSATAGTSDSYAHTWSNPVSASEKWSWTVSNLPHLYVNCVFNGTGADADDKVTVKTRGVSP